jgi:transposase
MNFPPYCPELNPQEHVWKEVRRELSEVIHEFNFQQVVDRACRILLTKKFEYSIFV